MPHKKREIALAISHHVNKAQCPNPFGYFSQNKTHVVTHGQYFIKEDINDADTLGFSFASFLY